MYILEHVEFMTVVCTKTWKCSRDSATTYVIVMSRVLARVTHVEDLRTTINAPSHSGGGVHYHNSSPLIGQH